MDLLRQSCIEIGIGPYNFEGLQELWRRQGKRVELGPEFDGMRPPSRPSEGPFLDRTRPRRERRRGRPDPVPPRVVLRRGAHEGARFDDFSHQFLKRYSWMYGARFLGPQFSTMHRVLSEIGGLLPPGAPVAAVTPATIRGWVLSRLRTGTPPDHISVYISYVRLAFDFAVEEQVLAHNPVDARKTWLPAKSRRDLPDGGGPAGRGEPDPGRDERSCSVMLRGRGMPVVVGRKEKPYPGDAAYDVIEAMAAEFPQGVAKASLERSRSGARKVLWKLRHDPDYAKAILFPGRAYGRGYRLATLGEFDRTHLSHLLDGDGR